MNDEFVVELKKVVERTVRPLRASASRKHRIREELLNHLREIVEEEAERLGDPQKALEVTRRRFGDPEELTCELQATIPRWERGRGVLETLRLEPGESISHFFGKQLLAGLIFYGVMLLLLLPMAWIRGQMLEWNLVLLIALIPTVAHMFFSFAFLLSADRMGRALYGRPSERSPRQAVLWGGASLAILPFATLLVYAVAMVTPEALRAAVTWACSVAPLIPVLVVLISRQVVAEAQREEEWTRLEIAE